ncbi:MAG: hypothetical protein EOP39_25185, partial [Rubrivivax sp.]
MLYTAQVKPRDRAQSFELTEVPKQPPGPQPTTAATTTASTTIEVPNPRGTWAGEDFGTNQEKAPSAMTLAEREKRTTFFQIQQRHYKRDHALTGLEAQHFDELTNRLVLRKNSVLDPFTAKALKKNPELSEALLDHAAGIAQKLAAAE